MKKKSQTQCNNVKWADDGLNFVTADETSNIGVRDLGGGEARNPDEERTKKIRIAPTSNPSCGPKPYRRYQTSSRKTKAPSVQITKRSR